MKNILIVESENDKFFVTALIKHLNLPNIDVTDAYLCQIDDYECMEGLSKEKLKLSINAVLNKANKDGIEKIGILLDQDNTSVKERLGLVNGSIKESSLKLDYDLLKDVSVLAKPTSNQAIELAAYFTNVNDSGELETLLKEIKSKDSSYADCLESWQDCLKNKSLSGLKKKDFDKFWVQIYIRYDTCSKNDQKQAGKKCNNEAAMSKPIWNFDHPCLDGLKSFLRLFN
jgi:hypothetical protein